MKLKYYFVKWGARLIRKGKINPSPSFKFTDRYKMPEFNISLLNGKSISTSEFKSKKIIIVNTASECGFTPQYKELEKLYQKNKNEIVVLAFPSNQFGNQEKGTDTEIQSFCEINYGVSFPLALKADVKGENAHPVFKWLTHPNQNGWNSKEPQWNFNKYLIDENGFLIAVYPSHLIPVIK